MSSKEAKFIKIGVLFLASICATSIIYHIASKEKQTQGSYEPYRAFSMKVSEEHWDESMMPAGKRSPKGVLYKPEGSNN
jgi:hypothetical protein